MLSIEYSQYIIIIIIISLFLSILLSYNYFSIIAGLLQSPYMAVNDPHNVGEHEVSEKSPETHKTLALSSQ